MPRKPIKKKYSSLTDDQITHLLIGDILDAPHEFVNVHGIMNFPFRDEAHRKELYFKHKNLLISIAERGFEDFFGTIKPGGLPAAFEQYDGKNKIKRGTK